MAKARYGFFGLDVTTGNTPRWKPGKAYGVVGFKMLRARDECGGWAKLEALRLKETVAAITVEAEHTITTVDSIERACIVQVYRGPCENEDFRFTMR